MLTLILTKKQLLTYKWGKLDKSTLGIELIIFTTIKLIEKILMQDYSEIDIYYIGYVTIKKIADYNNINSVNPLYLMINEMIGHFEEKNENKYLVLDDVDENKEVSKKYEEVREGVKKEIETIDGGKKVEYGKDF